jgi:signal transduction histidine kinase
LAIDNERLQAEIRAQLHEVRASRARIVQAADAERRRIERDLHDGSQQRLVTLSMALALARTRLGQTPDPQLDGLLVEAAGEVQLALSELRELARGIHPAILTEAGLGPALESLAQRSPVRVQIVATPAVRLPAAIEAAAYFVVAEALANVAKYASASNVTVAARVLDGVLCVEVVDDGRGGADTARGTGLQGLGDRVGALDGCFDVISPPGGGTCVRAELPL